MPHPTKHGLVVETDDEYHGDKDSWSKSQLWDVDTETPYAARFAVRENKPAFAIGKAAHIAILEPERLDDSVIRGPDDRRGNKWKEAEDYARFSDKILLTSGDHDTAMMIRDRAALVPELHVMREVDDDGRGPIIETSCYKEDPSGLTLRCRPDLYNPKHKLMVDIKNMASASPESWSKAIGDFGYHMQDAVYEDVWPASGLEVEGFWFLVFQKSDPVEVALYELTPDTLAEGHARYRRAVERTAECVKTGIWPSYPTSVQRVEMKPWGYKINPAPKG